MLGKQTKFTPIFGIYTPVKTLLLLLQSLTAKGLQHKTKFDV